MSKNQQRLFEMMIRLLGFINGRKTKELTEEQNQAISKLEEALDIMNDVYNKKLF